MSEKLSSQESATPPLRRLLAFDNRLFWISLAVLLAVLIPWLLLTPPGILGKADAIGYAVCHRIDQRSFQLPGERQFPMCARDTGTFLGVLVALFGPGLIFRRPRAGEYPPIGILAVMIAMSFWWAFDGANSFMHLLPDPRLPRLYPPSNFLRVVTGTFNGITLGSIILPMLNAALWQDATAERTIARASDLLILYAMGAAIIGLSLSRVAVFLYPLALLSAAGVLAILTAINTVLVITILQREGRARTLIEALPLFLLGLAATFALIGTIDALRFAMFGTWDGFVFPNS